MLSKLLFTFSLLFFAFGVDGQDQKLNLPPEKLSEYIAEIFGPEFEQNKPALADVFKDLLNNRIVLRETPQGQYEKYPVLSSFTLNNKNNSSIQPFNGQGFTIESFNPLRYGLNFFSDYTQVVRLDQTPFILIILPQ